MTDISELNLPKTTAMSFPNGKDDLMNFEVAVRPDEGYYLWVMIITFCALHVFVWSIFSNVFIYISLAQGRNIYFLFPSASLLSI